MFIKKFIRIFSKTMMIVLTVVFAIFLAIMFSILSNEHALESVTETVGTKTSTSQDPEGDHMDRLQVLEVLSGQSIDTASSSSDDTRTAPSAESVQPQTLDVLTAESSVDAYDDLLTEDEKAFVLQKINQ